MLDPNFLTLAYPFKSDGTGDEEIGVSIESMLRFSDQPLNVLIVGDKPKCQLPSNAVCVADEFHPDPLLDAVRKIGKINKLITRKFWIYCHDDMFALKPFTTDDLQVVRYTYYRQYQTWETHNRWARAKRYTMRLLNADEVYDTATHCPRLFKTDLVSQTLETAKQKPGLFDFQIAYDEMWTPPSLLKQVQETDDFVRVFEPPKSISDVEKACYGRKFLNTTTKGYNKYIARYVQAGNTETAAKPVSFQADRDFAKKLPIYTKCKHRGEDTGETVKCGTCNALTTDQPVFKCGMHGFATLRRPKRRHKTLKTKDCVSCFAEQKGFEKKEESHVQEQKNPIRIA